jgi:hypothetical protein
MMPLAQVTFEIDTIEERNTFLPETNQKLLGSKYGRLQYSRNDYLMINSFLAC